MGIDTAIWGPPTWAAIHLICLGAPETFKGSDQLSYKKFFDALPFVLPCEKCKRHLQEHLEKHPMDAALSGGRSTLFAWSVELHNIVNRSLDKPTMSVDDAMKLWSSYRYPGHCMKLHDVGHTQQPVAMCKRKKIQYIFFAIICIVFGMLLAVLALYFYMLPNS